MPQAGVGHVQVRQAQALKVTQSRQMNHLAVRYQPVGDDQRFKAAEQTQGGEELVRRPRVCFSQIDEGDLPEVVLPDKLSDPRREPRVAAAHVLPIAPLVVEPDLSPRISDRLHRAALGVHPVDPVPRPDGADEDEEHHGADAETKSASFAG